MKLQKRIARDLLGAGAWLMALALSCLLPLHARADESVNVTLNAGESYLIKDVPDGSLPRVQYTNSVVAFNVDRQPTGVVVLAVEAGSGTIAVKTNHGPVTYKVTVNALANWRDRLAPAGSAPRAIGDSHLSAAPAKSALDGSSDGAAAGAPAGRSATKTAALAGGSLAAAASPAQAAPTIPSQAVGATSAPIVGGKYTRNPPAATPIDSMAREPGIGGRHFLPNDAISMMTGTSRVYDFGVPIKRVSIADTKVADIQVVNPRQLMLIGHAPGFTTLVVWDSLGQYQERQVRIEKEGHQQVLLDVVVAEINRTKLENEGIDYSVAFAKYGLSLASLPGMVATPFGGASSSAVAPPGGNIFPLLLSNNITYALAAQNSQVLTNSFYEFLESNALGRVLARPRILANSGEEAKFLSGGEIPIVIAQALNTSVVFKQFGTSVVFLPTVIGKREVELVVKPEVSKPDFSQGVQLFGFTVPAFVTRRAETQVRMQEGQTLIIAGLLLDDVKSEVRKVPYLGDIPYAGALFRNTSYNHEKTELVMSVTPQIVQAIPEGGELGLPTDRGPLNSAEIRTREVNPPDASRPRLY